MSTSKEEITITFNLHSLFRVALIVSLFLFIIYTYGISLINFSPSFGQPYDPYDGGGGGGGGGASPILPPPVLINRPPKADAGGDQIAYVDELVYFNASKSKDPDGRIVRYSWDFGDNYSIGGMLQSHAYSEPRDYTVLLTVFDRWGASGSDTITVKVLSPPDPEDLKDYEPSEIVDVLSRLPPRTASDVLIGLNISMAASVLEQMNTSDATTVLFSTVHLINPIFSLDPEDYFSGIYSGRIDVKAVYGGSNVKWMQLDTLSFEEGASYRLQCRYKTTGGWTLRIILTDESWNPLLDTRQLLSSSDDWTSTPWMSFGPIPVEVNHTQIIAMVEGTGVYKFDDFSVEKVMSTGNVSVPIVPNPGFEDVFDTSPANWTAGVYEPADRFGRITGVAAIILELESSTAIPILLNTETWYATDIFEAMIEYNDSLGSGLWEQAFEEDKVKVIGILDEVDDDILLDALVAMSRLGYSPSTVAEMLALMEFEKVVTISRNWIALQALEELGSVLNHVSSETLNSIFEFLTVTEQALVYPYLNDEKVSSLRNELLPLPDLVPISVTITNIDNIGYNVTVTNLNQGRVSSNTTEVSFIVNDEIVNGTAMGVLDVDESTAISFVWKPVQTGNYDLTISLDRGNVIEEIDDLNNVLNKNVDVTLSDLEIRLFEITSDLVINKQVNLGGEIKNIGQEPVGSCTIEISYSGITGGAKWISKVLGTIEVNEIAPGKSKEFVLPWTPNESGDFELHVIVDPVNVILENDETNNGFQIPVKVVQRQLIWPLIGITIVLAVTSFLLYTNREIISEKIGAIRERGILP